MRKTIRFTGTPELDRAASAYIRRNASVFRIALVGIAVVATATYLLFSDRFDVAFGWILLGVALSAALTFLYVQSALHRAKNREPDYGPIQSQLTFTEEGFGYDNAVPDHFIPWPDVRRVRRTPDYWAIHYLRDGRETFIAIPPDAIDAELSVLILDHASFAGDKRPRSGHGVDR